MVGEDNEEEEAHLPSGQQGELLENDDQPPNRIDSNHRQRSRSPTGGGSVSMHTRNMLAFWMLGLCNNFGYVVMLSAAKDILEKSSEPAEPGKCIEDILSFKCSPVSTGAVLLADILPSFVIKLMAPFLFHSIPYLIRHSLVLICQVVSFLIVAYSDTMALGLLGVVFASLGAGLGEVTYLSLSSHFHGDVVSSWSSGTGGAGIFGALAFAALTDHRLLALSPKHALLFMLIVPLTLFLTFWRLLNSPPTIHRSLSNYQPVPTTSTGNSPPSSSDDLQSLLSSSPSPSPSTASTLTRLRARRIRPLLKYMFPLCVVYIAEYFINQGLLELLVFDCRHSFAMSPNSQYRWYQVLYQVGVFISRSSIKLCPIRAPFIPFLGLLQALNAIFLFEEAFFALHFLPHILLLMTIVFYEGLLGGLAYVNTFAAIHRTVSKANREFSMAFVSLSDSLGIVVAGFSAIYAHNFICAHRQQN